MGLLRLNLRLLQLQLGRYIVPHFKHVDGKFSMSSPTTYQTLNPIIFCPHTFLYHQLVHHIGFVYKRRKIIQKNLGHYNNYEIRRTYSFKTTTKNYKIVNKKIKYISRNLHRFFVFDKEREFCYPTSSVSFIFDGTYSWCA